MRWVCSPCSSSTLQRWPVSDGPMLRILRRCSRSRPSPKMETAVCGQFWFNFAVVKGSPGSRPSNTSAAKRARDPGYGFPAARALEAVVAFVVHHVKGSGRSIQRG